MQPPGTGKTKTIINTVKLLKVHFQVVHPILVCTFTNVAVDNLVEGFAAAGVKPVRVAFGSQVKSSLKEHTLDYKMEIHPLKPKLDGLIEEEQALKNYLLEQRKKIIAAMRKQKSPKLEQRIRNMKINANHSDRLRNLVRAKQYSMKQIMLREILSEADVVRITPLWNL